MTAARSTPSFAIAEKAPCSSYSSSYLFKAGGTGVTLTAADTVVHYDPWWNPAVEDQATDRAHRIGQTKTVHVIKLACSDTLEERMLDLGEDKRAAAESVLGKDGQGPKSLSLEEIEGMLDAEASRGF